MAESFSSQQLPVPIWRRALAMLRPSHRHTAFSATLLLMASAIASRVIGFVKVKYIAYLFGSSAQADAFNAAFQLPDMIAYFLVGGAASISFVTMLNRYDEAGKKAEGERVMSVILTTMLLVLGTAILAAEFFAPLYVKLFFDDFGSDPAKVALCIHLTRILLPAQLFFLAGGVFGAVLIARKQFNIQVVTPLIYNCGTIFGGLLLAKYIGVSSLAIGTVAGAFCGPFLLNAIYAHRSGMRYKPILEWSNPGLHEWVRMSVPLMLGVSLVTADNWIINHFAARIGGEISLLTYAKQLFTAPVALGQAAGIASLPFLASLYNKPDRMPFARTVNASVSRILAFSLLLSAWMVAMAHPAVDVVFRGGRFHHADAGAMGLYFAVFSISLCFWSAQAIYSRAFYAAGNTLTPMIASTLVVIASLPVYSMLFSTRGPLGLAIASDIGILIQTMVLAVLLNRRGMVPLAGLEYRELARSLVASAISFVALIALRHVFTSTSRLHELFLLIGATAVWGVVAGGVLKLTGSALPDQVLARFLKRA
jgi:putative peptidoglycan lipid II flippase